MKIACLKQAMACLKLTMVRLKQAMECLKLTTACLKQAVVRQL